MALPALAAVGGVSGAAGILGLIIGVGFMIGGAIQTSIDAKKAAKATSDAAIGNSLSSIISFHQSIPNVVYQQR